MRFFGSLLRMRRREADAKPCSFARLCACARTVALEHPLAQHGAIMPKAYWITCYREIKHPDKVAAYAKLAVPALAPFGARYLARGAPGATFESGLKERVVVTEWPSLAAAVARSEERRVGKKRR